MRRCWTIAAVLPVLAAVVACGAEEGSVESPPTSAPLPTESPSTSAVPSARALSLRYGDVTQRAVDIDADGRNTTAAVAGMNAFAIDLFKAVVAGRSDNVVVSPYSVTFALSMIYAGSRGQTAAEMAEVLHASIPAAAWQEGINAYDLTLDARTAGSPTTWAAANKVWTVPGLPLRSDYLDVLTGAYGSPLAEADFAADPDAQRALINGWVAEQTKERIPELFPSEALTSQTVMVPVNAVALDAPWEFPFDPAATRDEPFARPDGTTVDVAMMHYDEYLPSATGDAYQAVELPYGGGALSMVIIVPNDLAAYEAALTPESLAATIASIEDGGIHLSLPKWTARTHVTLSDTLAAMGMPTAFTDSADFSGMVDGGGLWIDRVEHEAFVEVDEQGTRAAAATGGGMVASHGPTVVVNRPYLYLIRDHGAGTILFVGHITDPSVTP
jgi:serpin B